MATEWDFPSYPKNWNEISRSIKERDNWTCQTCLRKSYEVDRLIAHHITSLSEGGSNRSDNLITVCDWCHGHIHRHKRKDIVSSPPSNRSQALSNVRQLKKHRVGTASDLRRSRAVPSETFPGVIPILMVLALLLIPVNLFVWIVVEVLLGVSWIGNRPKNPQKAPSTQPHNRKQTQKNSNTISVGSKVTLKRDDSTEPMTYKIVNPEETDLEKNQISLESPVGKALFGHSPGEEITVDTPSGMKVFIITGIENGG